jgi:hypothetical protein
MPAQEFTIIYVLNVKSALKQREGTIAAGIKKKGFVFRQRITKSILFKLS